MATNNKKPDRRVQLIRDALCQGYGAVHHRAKIDVYRYNSACVRIRILDPDFAGMDILDREQIMWRALEALPDDVVTQISFLLPLTPKETKTSGANMVAGSAAGGLSLEAAVRSWDSSAWTF